jgi:hypothetical protein
VADLRINSPANPYNASRSSDATSARAASAQWSAEVAAQKAASNGNLPNQPTANNNGRPSNEPAATNKNGTQPAQAATASPVADQKPGAGSNLSLWIHGGLTAGSFLPSLIGAGFSAADGLVYGIEGDRTNAALSFGAAGVGLFTDAGIAKVAALGLGAAAKALKVGEAAVKVEKEVNGIAKVGEAVVNADKEANTAVKAGETAEPVVAQNASAKAPKSTDVVSSPDLKTKPAGPRIRSKYADNTPVYQGQQPPRIRGPDPAAQGGHSVLRHDTVNNRIYQAREFDAAGHPVRDIDFTNPTYPNGAPRPGHPGPPHQHRFFTNNPDVGPRSGFRRNGPEPMP